jgi:hypothetical protein
MEEETEGITLRCVNERLVKNEPFAHFFLFYPLLYYSIFTGGHHSRPNLYAFGRHR